MAPQTESKCVIFSVMLLLGNYEESFFPPFTLKCKKYYNIFLGLLIRNRSCLYHFLLYIKCYHLEMNDEVPAVVGDILVANLARVHNLHHHA